MRVSTAARDRSPHAHRCARRSPFALVALVPALVAASAVQGVSAPRASGFEARLTSFEVVPSLLTAGTGQFTATFSRPDAVSYRLTYSGLSSPALAAHIHFAQRGDNGGIVVFLCGGGDKPQCPAGGGTVSGTITAADVAEVSDQGVKAGDLPGLMRAIQSGAAYVLVHTTKFPAGEIRGQIQSGRP